MLQYRILFTVVLIVLFFATFAFANSGGEAVAVYTNTPPVIDGEDDWPAKVWAFAQEHDMHMKPEDVPDWFIFPKTSPNRVSRGVIDDNNDFSMEFAFMYDKEWLYYIGVFVDDNLPVDLNTNEADEPVDRGATGSGAPQTSEWWLEFDFENDAPKKPKGNDDQALAAVPDCLYQPGDHFWWLKPWSGAGTTRPACFESNGQNAVLDGGTVYRFDHECASNMAASKTADGMIIEGKLKFKTMFEMAHEPDLPVPRPGTIWGFDSTASDVEEKGAEREGAISWASSFENDNCVCILGDLIFVRQLAVNAKDKLPVTWGRIKSHLNQ
jgi:hypothetical protein